MLRTYKNQFMFYSKFLDFIKKNISFLKFTYHTIDFDWAVHWSARLNRTIHCSYYLKDGIHVSVGGVVHPRYKESFSSISYASMSFYFFSDNFCDKSFCVLLYSVTNIRETFLFGLIHLYIVFVHWIWHSFVNSKVNGRESVFYFQTDQSCCNTWKSVKLHVKLHVLVAWLFLFSKFKTYDSLKRCICR